MDLACIYLIPCWGTSMKTTFISFQILNQSTCFYIMSPTCIDPEAPTIHSNFASELTETYHATFMHPTPIPPFFDPPPLPLLKNVVGHVAHIKRWLNHYVYLFLNVWGSQFLQGLNIPFASSLARAPCTLWTNHKGIAIEWWQRFLD